MAGGFEVEYHKHGMTVQGQGGYGGGVPVSALEGIGALATAHDPSWDQLDGRLPWALKVTLVIGSKDSLDVWCQEVEERLSREEDDLIIRWWKGTTGGTSSRWLLSCLYHEAHRVQLAEPVPGEPHWVPTDRPPWLATDIRESYPSDASDFGRCVNLLDSTGLRPKLPFVRGRWAKYVARWSELEQAWLRDEKDVVRKILDACRP